MHAPQEIHWQAILCVLAYLNHALGRGLLYLQHNYLCLEAYSDSSYASDCGDQKSISGYSTFIMGTLSHGGVKNNMLSLSPVLNLHIML